MIETFLDLGRLGLGLASLVWPGYVLAAWTAPSLSRLERAAVGFGLGPLILTLWMLALGGLGLPLRWPLVAAPPLVLTCAGWLGCKVLRGRTGNPPAPWPPARASEPFRGWDWVFAGLLTLLGLFVTLRAVLYPLWAWDAYATWGFKGKVFFLQEAIYLRGFDAHNYYPNLVPLTLTYLYLWLGQVNDHLVKLVFPLWGGALLAMLGGLLRRLGLNRTQALGLTCFYALNGLTLISHLHIVYADLALTYYTLGAAGWLYLWLWRAAPTGVLGLTALFSAGAAWTKFEGPPLVGTVILAAGLTLLWLRPPDLGRRLAGLGWPLAGLLLGYLPWRLYALSHGIETGSDHILGMYPHQFLKALPALLAALVSPTLFGVLWPAAALALILAGKRLFRTPLLYLALFLGGNLLAILLAYLVAPTSPFEFHLYLRATLDRLLLHLTPVAALLAGEGLKEAGGGAGTARAGQPRPSLPPTQPA